MSSIPTIASTLSDDVTVTAAYKTMIKLEEQITMFTKRLSDLQVQYVAAKLALQPIIIKSLTPPVI